MQKKKFFIQQLLDRSNLTEENIPGNPIVELLGESRVLIENHRGITEYGLSRICVQVNYGFLCVIGGNLKLRHVTKHKLLITGEICNIEVVRRLR